MPKVKKVAVLDLSGSANEIRSLEFTVEQYDYNDLQTEKTQKEIEFESDLNFLLENNETVNENAVKAKKYRKKRSLNIAKAVKASSKVSPKEITKDIADITFLSDEEADKSKVKRAPHTTRPKKGNRKGSKEPRKEGNAIADEVKEKGEKLGEPSTQILETSGNEVAGEPGTTKIENGGTDGEIPDAPTKPKRKTRRSKKKSKSANNSKLLDTSELPDSSGFIDSTMDQSFIGSEKSLPDILLLNESTADKAEFAKVSTPLALTPPPASSSQSPVSLDIPVSSNTKSPLASPSGLASPPELSPLPSTLTPRGQSPSTLSDVTPKADLRRMYSSAKATSLTQLPPIQPVATIFGLSHSQIFRLKLTDVKIKTIMSVPMSKMCNNLLSFAMKESEGLFADKEKRALFVALCIAVALYESNGFHTVTKERPQMLEWLGEYEHLTLAYTKTNLTASNKLAHMNDFDYTVFSFFGHILIWAMYVQHQTSLEALTEKFETISDKYDLGVSMKDITSSFGGYHLWDRLRRDPKTINTKRWKHIQKFRQLFAFEENQFVLILRCMNLDVLIP